MDNLEHKRIYIPIMQQHKNKIINLTSRRLAPLSVVAILLQLCTPFFSSTALAAGAMTYTLVRTDRMTANTATTGTVCAKPASTATEASVVVTFPTGYNVSTTLSNWAVSTATTTSWPADPANNSTTATAWPSIAQPTSGGVSGQAVTFGSGDLTVGTWYCFNWTNSAALTTKTTAAANLTGNVTTQTSTPTAIDSGDFATATVTNDQIAVTATVSPQFNFQLSSNSAALGTLSSSSPTASSAINARVDTNAGSGWDMWADDPGTPVGLHSTTAGYTVAYSPTVGSTSSALSNGVEGYNLGLGTSSQTSGTGTISESANFSSGGTSYKGGGLDGTPRILGYSTGSANNAVIPLTINASISVTTPAATDYADTINVIAAGRF
jgi:hypothetical protein